MREVCVCVPARDEAGRLPILLGALARQTVPARLKIVLCINNSCDDGAVTARTWGAGDRRVELDVIERHFEPPLAHAGSARRAAMDRGAEWLGDASGVLVSTDADCRPPPQWIEAILAAMTHDDHIVGGRLALDADEPLDPAVLALRARWERYWREVRAVEDAIDPCAWDPPPRHGDHTGASLALTAGLYRRAGGVPLAPSGEDLALVGAAQAVGGRLVHPPSVWTWVSGRTDGRAEGGMAAHMGDLLVCASKGAVPLAPRLAHWRERAEWRRRTRTVLSREAFVQAERSLPPLPCDTALPELQP